MATRQASILCHETHDLVLESYLFLLQGFNRRIHALQIILETRVLTLDSHDLFI